MNKNTVILIASWLCVFLTMLMIFSFSSEDAGKSTETSSELIENVLETVLPKEEITPEVVKKYQFPFRKVAHFGIYLLLGFSLANAFRYTLKRKWYVCYPCALLASVLYAVSDEWHQNFSAGRGPSLKDVLIDSGGALFGILIYVAFLLLYSFLKNKKSKKPII